MRACILICKSSKVTEACIKIFVIAHRFFVCTLLPSSKQCGQMGFLSICAKHQHFPDFTCSNIWRNYIKNSLIMVMTTLYININKIHSSNYIWCISPHKLLTVKSNLFLYKIFKMHNLDSRHK